MSERPINFSGDMVRATRAGRKTQTRRPIIPQPVPLYSKTIDRFEYSGGFWWPTSHSGVQAAWKPVRYRCPYGEPGDQLWVRETWGAVSPPGLIACCLEDCEIQYRADLPPGCTDYPGQWPADEARGNPDAPKWRASIHMRRWASRITLDVLRVRVERVQEISERDAYAEGQVLPRVITRTTTIEWPTTWFRDLWDDIYAKRGLGWGANPWIFVIDFSRIKQ